jgi:hypothetical protein
MHENAELKDRIQDLEHTILQLQSETETTGRMKKIIFLIWMNYFSVGDYIHLYQQQRDIGNIDQLQ